MFAYVVNNQVQVVGSPPALLSGGEWLEVQETNPPSVTSTQRAVSSVEMVSGTPTRVWTVRDESSEEANQRIREVNRLTLETVQDALAFVEANEAYLTWYNSPTIQSIITGSGNMTSAQLSQAIRNLAPQVERLTRGLNRTIRVVIGDELLDSTASS